MARIPQEPKEEHIHYLKSLVHIGFSKSVLTSYDCTTLAESIERTIDEKLSVDTLRRFFGVIKSVSLPSTYTLDVLSKYVGYKNWSDLILGHQEQCELHQKHLLFELITKNIPFQELLVRFNSFPKTTAVYDLFKQVILIKIEQKDVAFFENIFKFQLIFEFQESFKYAIYHTIHLLGSLCSIHEWLKDIAINNYYNLPYCEDYFVEWLVVPEQDYYLEVLEKYYEVNQDNLDKKTFYHLIHCTTAAKKGIWEVFTMHYSVLMELNINVNSLHNILQMRWYGVQMLHDKQYNNGFKIEKICNAFCESAAINEKDAGNRVSSIFIITQYLFAIENYLLIITLFEKQAAKFSNILGYWALLNYDHLKVYYAFALLKTNQAEKATLVFKEIKPNKFDLNFKTEVEAIYHSMQFDTIN
ncbi:hypothetical protein [Flavobacterium sp.]|uniref:hypothetical protein n=1 Tax=Flavobacterium sp. TaxID=239 RepID=UPI0024898AAF|nr:hypothetical protein [Flavobacterium sp.]MDI1317757.1 hypothetical protein [Flavobacterium sp.]